MPANLSAADVRQALAKSVKADVDLTKIGDEDDLFEHAVLDSLGTMAFVGELESSFNVQLGDDEIFSPEFTTISGIASLLGQKS